MSTDTHKTGAGSNGARPVLITGGAGFVGTNLAHRLLSAGERVLLFDNLSRPGVPKNLRWLQETHGRQMEVQIADVCDSKAVAEAVRRASSVFHFAAQVAVTTSLEDPATDFAVNAQGTFNVLEAVRKTGVPVVFTSTNKVYGNLEDVPIRRRGSRYEPADEVVRKSGISEQQRLSFHSPYGCSKGAADQYVLDYARSYGLPLVVFRMSCIYGPHQFGTEDQGWVAHFLIRALERRPIVLYGDGFQVRDILFVEDLVEAFLLARRHARQESGQAFNIGGGPSHTVSLLELLEMIGEMEEEEPVVEHAPWRIGDQRYYVSDYTKFANATGWSPRVAPREGIRRLHSWLRSLRAKPLPELVSN